MPCSLNGKWNCLFLITLSAEVVSQFSSSWFKSFRIGADTFEAKCKSVRNIFATSMWHNYQYMSIFTLDFCIAKIEHYIFKQVSWRKGHRKEKKKKKKKQHNNNLLYAMIRKKNLTAMSWGRAKSKKKKKKKNVRSVGTAICSARTKMAKYTN